MLTQLKVTRTSGWALFSLAAGALMYLLMPRPVERLGPLTFQTGAINVGLHKGELLFRDPHPGLSLYRQRLEGGPPAPVFPAQDLPVRVNSTEQLEDGVIFRCTLVPNASRAGVAPFTVAQRAEPPAGVMSSTALVGRDRVYFAALDGTPPREVLKDRRYRWIILGKTCYGLSGRPQMSSNFGQVSSIIGVEGRRPPPPPPPPPVELVAAPLFGGPTRPIKVLPGGVALHSIAEGVGWYERSRDGELASCLHFALPPSFEEVEVKRFTPVQETVLLKEQRLYWVNAVQSPGQESAGPYELVSSALDGTDARVIYQSAGARPEPLGKHRGELYFRVALQPFDRQVSALYQLTPDDSLKRIAILPPGSDSGFLADGYYYTSAQENVENWLDWSPQGVILKIETRMYRVRLPS